MCTLNSRRSIILCMCVPPDSPEPVSATFAKEQSEAHGPAAARCQAFRADNWWC